MSTGPRGWGFRRRLAVSITATFVALGAALVGLQLLVLDGSFRAVITLGTGEGGAGDLSGTVADACATDPAAAACGTGGTSAQDGYGRALAEDVTGRYLGWSLVLLAAFTVLAAVLAWRLTRGPARRIAGIAELAGEISEQDLSRRLDLPGPRDEITDLADRFDTMLARLQSAFADRERFVANASHELRTPITATRAALEAPLTQGRVPAELEPYLRRALRANQRMEELITALLSIARTRHLHAGDLQDLALGALVTEAVDGIRDRAGARGIAVVLDLPATAVLVRGHRASLMIALGNLLDNAVRHNRDGGRVRVGVTQGRGRAAVLVANTGPTYSAEEAHELLQPFSRGQHTRRAGTPGTGLGLSVVTSIAAAQDGTVEVSPGAEDGLSVSLTLPLAPRGGRERGRDPRRAEVTAPDEARRR